MEDFIFTPIVLAVGFAIHAVVLRLHRPDEARVLSTSFALHVVACIGLTLVYQYYYGSGDLLNYHRLSVPIAEAMRFDFENIGVEVTRMLFQQEHRLPFLVNGDGSTGSMQAVSVFLCFFTGDSLYASSMVITLGSWLSKLLIFRALSPGLSVQERRFALLAIMLSPSGIVWTSALLKEPMVMVFMGPFFLGVRWLIEGRRFTVAVASIVLAGGAIALFKPYVLVALVAASGVWVAWARAPGGAASLVSRPRNLLLGICLIGFGFSASSTLFPGLALESIEESVTNQRRAAMTDEGDSNFSIEETGLDRDAPIQRGLAAQLALTPLALGTALFRPFLFEARKAMQFLNALESTWLLVLAFQVLTRARIAATTTRILTSPALMMSLTLVLILGLGTGLSTANLGTLSRYRAPMMPFFLFILLALRGSAPRAEAVGLEVRHVSA